ncbi:MAG: alpha/beta hydrolase [Betaproteobacteria bacterium]|nr:alpha/beta hydrolase [Betaproteobacteria bacterium]
MPTIEKNGATIYYEEHGQGFPILTFAPAGLLSTIKVWDTAMAPVKPVAEWSSNYRVIVMDQRNAGGRSRATLTAQDGWDSYTADHIAVLDHLKIERCHVFGQCIGGSFIFNLLKKQPQRVAAAVIAQPIGRVGELKPGRPERFNDWAKSLDPAPSDAVLDAFYQNLYAPGFVYSADRAFVGSLKLPTLLLAGNDEAHPRPISDECSKLLQNVEYILDWKVGDPLAAAQARIKTFLAQHTPK